MTKRYNFFDLCHGTMLGDEMFVRASDYDALVVAATKACQDMGCYCAAHHDELADDQLSPICQLGRLIQSAEGKSMADSTELYYAEMEAARNEVIDAYFEASPKFDYPFPREAFKAGFERGFKVMWDRWLAHQLGRGAE
ncbi:MAG TPA: hypothetical protein VNU68_07080 [Verrucomicrobiae bacterium]|nr:hypothetical protein [Verrucomicrobiae bacterium]